MHSVVHVVGVFVDPLVTLIDIIKNITHLSFFKFRELTMHDARAASVFGIRLALK